MNSTQGRPLVLPGLLPRNTTERRPWPLISDAVRSLMLTDEAKAHIYELRREVAQLADVNNAPRETKRRPPVRGAVLLVPWGLPNVWCVQFGQRFRLRLYPFQSA
jgi:hypothetical protein